VLEKLDLETAIYRILSNEEGPSQNELFRKLEDYTKNVEKLDLILKVDSSSLSRKLKSLEKDEIVLHITKKMEYRDQEAYSYFIKKDLVAFEHTMRHLAENIDKALDISPLNVRDMRKFLEIKDNKPRELTVDSKCELIRSFIRSPYVKDLINTCGFEPVYQTFKKIELYNFCGLEEFIEHARNLIHDGSVNNLKIFGEEFLHDSEAWKCARDLLSGLYTRH
jgi:hypothetical protein